MKTALIGYTGFVGGNLSSQHTFTDYYNSKNIAEIAGQDYDLIVSAATRADMWRINQEADIDRAEIDSLINHLTQVKARRFVLISTVGVYRNPAGADEDTPLETKGLPPYGVNRAYLERYCQEHFDALVVRLPGLFGPGLKKNVIFDLLNDNNVDRIHHAGSYQYYNLANIWRDITIALDNGLSVINFATEPVTTGEVARECFGIDFANAPADITPATWDMHSKHATLYAATPPYLYSKQQVLSEIAAFVAIERAT